MWLKILLLNLEVINAIVAPKNVKCVNVVLENKQVGGFHVWKKKEVIG
jgi:hypothetical protein